MHPSQPRSAPRPEEPTGPTVSDAVIEAIARGDERSDEICSRVISTAQRLWEQRCAEPGRASLRDAVQFVKRPLDESVPSMPSVTVEHMATPAPVEGVGATPGQYRMLLLDENGPLDEVSLDEVSLDEAIAAPGSDEAIESMSRAWVDRLYARVGTFTSLQRASLQKQDTEISVAREGLEKQKTEISVAQQALKKQAVEIRYARLGVWIAVVSLVITAIGVGFGISIGRPSAPALPAQAITVSAVRSMPMLAPKEERFVSAEMVRVGDELSVFSGTSAGEHADRLVLIEGGAVDDVPGGVLEVFRAESPGMLHVLGLRTRRVPSPEERAAVDASLRSLAGAQPLPSGIHAVWEGTGLSYRRATTREGDTPEPTPTFTEAAAALHTTLDETLGAGNWLLDGRSFLVSPADAPEPEDAP